MLLLPGMGLLLWRGRKDHTWRAMVLVCVIGFSGFLVSCGGGGNPTPVPPPPLPPPVEFDYEETPTPSPANPPTPIPTNPSNPVPTPTPCPTPSILGPFNLTVYIYALESDPNFSTDARETPALDSEGNVIGYYRKSFLEQSTGGVVMQGTGKTEDDEYIRYVNGWPDNPIFARGEGGRFSRSIAFSTVATGVPNLQSGDVIKFIDLQDERFAGEFTVTDTGEGVGVNDIDIFVGEMTLNEAYALSAEVARGSRIEIVRKAGN